MNPPLETDETNLKEMAEPMPQYIIRAPWYTTSGLEEITTLRHQKLLKKKEIDLLQQITLQKEAFLKEVCIDIAKVLVKIVEQ